jgi:hypothetical protein
MRQQIKVDGVWVIGTPEPKEWYKQEVAKDIWEEQRNMPVVIKAPIAIRIITKGSMQSRFSISEEVAISSGTDEIAKVLLSRMLNSKDINLDLEEFTSGLGYVVPYLDSIGMIYLGASIQERMDKLTENGTEDERA